VFFLTSGLETLQGPTAGRLHGRDQWEWKIEEAMDDNDFRRVPSPPKFLIGLRYLGGGA